MVKQLNLYEAKTQLSKLVEEAASGQEIIIAKSGKAMARLVSAKENPSSDGNLVMAWASLLAPEDRAYLASEQFVRDWKEFDVAVDQPNSRSRMLHTIRALFATALGLPLTKRSGDSSYNDISSQKPSLN